MHYSNNSQDENYILLCKFDIISFTKFLSISLKSTCILSNIDDVKLLYKLDVLGLISPLNEDDIWKATGRNLKCSAEDNSVI